MKFRMVESMALVGSRIRHTWDSLTKPEVEVIRILIMFDVTSAKKDGQRFH